MSALKNFPLAAHQNTPSLDTFDEDEITEQPRVIKRRGRPAGFKMPKRQKSPGAKTQIRRKKQAEFSPPKTDISIAMVEPVAYFADEIMQAGRDISTLIHLARKIRPSQIEAVIAEIERVKFSPFAAIPDGALEEAKAALVFIEALQII